MVKSESIKNNYIKLLEFGKAEAVQMPVLLSNNILKRIEYYKDSNPPIESAPFEGGLFFENSNWKKNSEGEIVDSITIIYDRDWLELRVLNPVTGEIGELIGSGRL